MHIVGRETSTYVPLTSALHQTQRRVRRVRNFLDNNICFISFRWNVIACDLLKEHMHAS